VNRFGSEGQPFTSVATASEERANSTTLAGCEANCFERAQNAQPPSDDLPQLRCDNECRPLADDLRQTQQELQQKTDELRRAYDQNGGMPVGDAAVPVAIQTILDDISDIEDEIDSLTERSAACTADCEAELDRRTAICAATCAPCFDEPTQYCVGGEVVEWDGNPLFFPVDS